MGSVEHSAAHQVAVYTWLRPHLYEYACSLAGGPLHTINHITHEHYLAKLVLGQLTKQQPPPLPGSFIAQRRRFVSHIGIKMFYRRGAWVPLHGQRHIEHMLRLHYYSSLHHYVLGQLHAGMATARAIRQWMDLHEISAEHCDYQHLHVRLAQGVAGLPPLRKAQRA